MIKFKVLTLKNFMSVGNVTQYIHFANHKLTLILGENLDLGGQGNRNGVGKTVSINALSFALYGTPIVTIKKDNLINDENLKGMVVSLDYEIDGKSFRIERGRKPNFCRYFVNNNILKSPVDDETAGESKWTQDKIVRDLNGLSHNLFKYIVCLHIKTTPFLARKEKEQRELIEELLGITQLSEKAEILKEQTKQVKDEIRSEEIRVKASIDSNEKIQKHITDLRFKSSLWDKAQTNRIVQLTQTISGHANVDIDLEIKAHRNYETWQSYQQNIALLQGKIDQGSTQKNRLVSKQSGLSLQFSKLEEHSCPTCGQAVHDEKLIHIKQNVQNEMDALVLECKSIESEQEQLAADLQNLVDNPPELEEIDYSKLGDSLTYRNIEESLKHKHKVDILVADLERERAAVNPFIEQISGLTESALQPISYDYINELSRLKDHQEFLYKMLTSNESFIRKKIIDQNLSYLNRSLNAYLSQLNLPHEVTFKNDLSIDITKLGKEYDYDQLSSGQSNRLILALSWAFRDTWESRNHRVNLLMIDELIDQGLDEQGMDASINLLKDMSENRNIFLISHKDGLEDRMDDVLLVQMENKFTSFSDTMMET